jgi:hypothetical protein
MEGRKKEIEEKETGRRRRGSKKIRHGGRNRMDGAKEWQLGCAGFA